MSRKKISAYAGLLDIEIEQGAEFTVSMTWKDKATGTPKDITGWTGKMQIRQTNRSKTLLYELTTGNGLIVLGGVTGTIDLTIPYTDTVKFTWAEAEYDLELYDAGGKAKRLVRGKVTVIPEITK